MLKTKPRGKTKIIKDYGIEDIYRFYKSRTNNPVSYDKFSIFLLGKRTGIKGMFRDIRDYIVYKAYTFIIPYRLGSLRVRRITPEIRFFPDGKLDYKNSLMRVDWKATKDYWENNSEAREKKIKIYHKNLHTRGDITKPYWDKYSSNVKNRTVYKFKAVRDFDRMIPKALKSGDKSIDYFK